MPIDPNARRPPQFPPFSVVNRLYGRTEPLTTPRLHLDEGHLVLALHDEIDIAMAAAEPVCHEPPSVSHEPASRDAFPQQPEILTRFRHGASLQPTADKSRTNS